MAFIDYYKIMGVSKDIPQKDIRKAYLKRTKQFHPDLHPDDPKSKAKFQALNEAYEVLSDPDKRAKYDKYGEQWRNAEAYEKAGFGGSRSEGAGGGGSFDGFDFNSFSSGGGGFSSFFQDLFGGGRGRSSFHSHFSGGGTSDAFGGFGTQRQNTGQMEAKVSIDMYTALLGGEIIIQLSNGAKIRLKVKPGTQNGTKVRLRSKGYDRGDGTYGDLIISYNVKLPASLSERQKQLLREMKES
ncbi:MAG TPA: heat-shock protein [Prevotella sp.]|nr:heat-shock protein [Prevotella sp.]